MSILKWELENAKSKYFAYGDLVYWGHSPIAVGDFLIEITANKSTEGCLPKQDLPLQNYTHYQIRFTDADLKVAINPWTDQRFKDDDNFKKVYKSSSDHANYVSFDDLQVLHELLWIYSKK